MYIHNLILRDFRNYEQLDLPLERGLSAFVGLNGQGKTNLLEATCFLATTKSQRTHLDRDLIRWEQEFLCARAEFTNGEARTNEAEVIVTRQGQKRAKLNGVDRQQVSDWLGNLNVSGFFPEDVGLVSGRPTLRRQFLDLELSKLESKYRYHWVQYRRLLSHRNALLRELRAFRRQNSSLPELSEQLSEHGAEMIAARHAYVGELAPHVTEVHRRLSRDREALSLRYECSVKEAPLGEAAALRVAFAEGLHARAEADIDRGTTGLGPHRDDLALQLQGRDLRKFASQGQRRTAALAMRIATATAMQERLGDAPLLILDDALSELDADRRFELLELASRMDQVLLTTTDSELGRLRDLCNGTIIEVCDGKVLAPA